MEFIDTYYTSRFLRNLTSIIRRKEKCKVINRATYNAFVCLPIDDPVVKLLAKQPIS